MPHKPFVNKKILAHRSTVGEKIRQLRGERQITLKEMSATSGVSIAHISEMERGRISPTVNTILKVANGFKKPVSFFLPDEYLTSVQITRGDEQKVTESNRTKEIDLSSGLPGATLQAKQVILGKGRYIQPSLEPWSEALGIILRGEIELMLNGKTFRLKTGDVFHITEGTLQQARNMGRGESEMMWFVLPYPGSL